MQANDFGRGFLAAAASDIRRALGMAAASDANAPNALRLSFGQMDRVPSGIVALVSVCQRPERTQLLAL